MSGFRVQGLESREGVLSSKKSHVPTSHRATSRTALPNNRLHAPTPPRNPHVPREPTSSTVEDSFLRTQGLALHDLLLRLSG